MKKLPPLNKDEIKARILDNARKTGPEAFPYTEMGRAMVMAAIV